MPQISRLLAGKKNPSRINLYLDGEFAFALSLDEVVKNNLKKGLHLTEDQVQALKKQDDLNWAYTKILNYLSYRPRSEAEVIARLKKYQVSEVTNIDWVINKLKEQGYLSDISFAKWFVASRASNRPRSTRHLTAELLAKGVSTQVVKEVVNGVDDTVALEHLITKKSSLSRDKLTQFLLRRGFSYGLVKAKLDELGIKG